MLTLHDVLGPAVAGHAEAQLSVRIPEAQPGTLCISNPGQQRALPPTPLQQHLIHYDRRLHALQGKS